MKFAVEPAEAGVKVPPHPVEGPMTPEGALWIADQYTLRLIADGVIRRKDGDTDEAALERMRPRKTEAPAEPAAEAPADTAPKPEAAQAARRSPARTDAAPAAPAPKEA